MKKRQILFALLISGLLFACSLFPYAPEAAPATALIVTPTNVQPIPSDTPALAGNMVYLWPLSVPEGFSLNPENSRADANGFQLEFRNSDQGISLVIRGGAEADRYEYCQNLEDNPSTPVTVRGLDGCIPPATGGGFTVEWKENGIHYMVGGMGISKELALSIVEQLEVIDLTTWLERLSSAKN
jgi:hypothetical protein